MFSQFHKKPFKARIKDTGYLLKNSFVIIGKDSDIIKPTIRMAIYSVVLITLFFISLLTFFTGNFVGTGILLLLFVVFVLFPFKFFAGQRNQDQGIVPFLINLFLAALLEVWDLLSHYLIPAIVDEQKRLRE